MRIVSPDRRSAFGFAPASNSVRTTDGLPFDLPLTLSRPVIQRRLTGPYS